jgi:hypothetical protein
MEGHKTPKLTSGVQNALLNALLKEGRAIREDEVEDVGSYRMAFTK